MNGPGGSRERDMTLTLMAVLAADRRDQLAWLGGRALDTGALAEEAELFCRVCEELADRGLFEPEALRGLRAVRRTLGGLAAADRAAPWSDALTTDPAWDEIRTLARGILVSELGDWRRPLPRPARPAGPPAGDR
ncbi:hypothetical protein [Streptomyces sp. NRRL S-87]|uniref:hypothetical protein n=1 Tax=Streptomyces sp. NRRL S-87 TaxID=1463920 RepID=UPI00055C7E68|nr:hypothetical protein [Streptomyces sp. NRRL S-87]